MKPEHGDAEAAVVVALAMGAGMLAQIVARHLRLPGIVILLAAGVALGPDGAGWIVPANIGDGLHIIVGFAVAVILFEGGMNLRWSRLRHEAGVIQRLVTVGALVTALGGTLAARFVMGWSWTLAVPFGTLVVVTGPTVVTPLLRRIRVRHRVATVLEAEGVLIDAVGAVLAVVALQVVLVGPAGSSIAAGIGAILGRLAFGLVVGSLAGLLIGFLLRFKKVVPEGFENVFTLSFVLVLFQLSNLWMHESGIMAVTAAGMVVGNMKTRALRELMEFKEQLTVMLIGMLFVLLAADVRVQSIVDLGWRGALTVAALMFVVRPLNVLASTYGSKMETRDRLFLCWLAPRGVVAAAVASLFADSLDAAGVDGGDDLRGLVFLVIAATVLLQGLTGSLVARLLGVRRPPHHGYAILGANDLGLAIGRLLVQANESVMFIDSNPGACKKAQEEGYRVVFGNVIEERTLQRAQIEDRAAAIAVTPNEEINLMWARTVGSRFDVERVYVACRRDRSTVTAALVAQADASVLFGSPRDLELWSLRFRRGTAVVQQWRPLEPVLSEFPPNLVLPLLVHRKDRARPYDGSRPVGRKESVSLALFADRIDEATAWLESNGYVKNGDTIAS
jgi:NhaP-type Na+/H+ or K+/H+ antiporter